MVDTKQNTNLPSKTWVAKPIVPWSQTSDRTQTVQPQVATTSWLTAQQQFNALNPQQQQQFLAQNKGNAQVQSLAQPSVNNPLGDPVITQQQTQMTAPKLDANQLLWQVQADKQAWMTDQQLQDKYKSQYDQLLWQPKQTTTPPTVTPPTTPQPTVQPTVSKPTVNPQDKYIQDTLKKWLIPDVFGTKISELEKTTPWITEKRNQQYIAELQAQGWLTSKNIDQKVRDLLKAKWIENFVTTSKDVENTVQSISSRLKPDLEKMERTNSLIMTSSDKVAWDYFNGKISDTDLENIKLTDPAKYEEIKVANQKLEQSYISNQNIQIYWEILGDKKTQQVTIPSPLQQIQEKMLSFFSNTNPTADVFAQYKAELNNPELVKMQDELSDSTRKLEDLDKTIKATADEVKAQYPWLSKSYIWALIQDRTDALMKQRDSLVLDLKNTQNKITTRMDNAKENYQLSLEQAKMERQNKLDQFQQLGTVYGMMKDEYDRQDKYNYAQFQADLEMEQSFKKLDMQEKFLKWDVTSKDPAQVKKAVDYAVWQTLEEFSGLPISRSREKIVEDIQYWLSTGKYKSLWQAIDENLRKPIQWKKEYEQWSKKKAWISWPTYIDIWWQKYIDKNWDWNLTKVNVQDHGNIWDAKTRQERQSIYKSMINNYGGGASWVVNTARSIPNGTTWWQCWAYINDIVKGKPWWIQDSLDSKIKMVTPWATAEQWNVMVVDTGSKNPNWHVALVLSSWDGTVTVSESNADWKSEKITQTTYSIDKNWQLIKPDWSVFGTLKWYIKPDYAQQTTTWNEPTEAEKQLFLWNKIWWKTWLSQERFNQVAERYKKNQQPLDEKQWTQANQIRTAFKSDPQVKTFEEALSQWSNLITSLNEANWPWDVAWVYQFMKTLDPTSVVRESEFDMAAWSAWVASRVGNMFQKLANWEVLTSEQRKDFWKIAKQYILNRAKMYDYKYDDSVKILRNQWIDPSWFFYGRSSDMLREMLWEWTSQNQQTDIRSIFKTQWVNTQTPTWNTWFNFSDFSF